MSGKSPKSAGISPTQEKVFEMDAIFEARNLIEQIAGPSAVGERVKRSLEIVSRKTGLSVRRVRGIWNNEARAIRSEEMDALRAAKQKALEGKARDELLEIKSRMHRIETILAAAYPDLDRQVFAQVKQLYLGPDPEGRS